MTSADIEQRKNGSNKSDQNKTLDFHKLVQANPEPWFYWFRRGDAYRERGKAYLKKGNYHRAIADFNTLIQLDSNRADSYRDRGVAYGLKGDLDRAIADFDKAIQLNPQLKDAHYNRGYAYQLKGDQDRARADFDKENQLYPRDIPADDAQSKANDNAQSRTADGELLPVRKSAVDQEIEDAKKRGEVVLTRCLVNCENSVDQTTDGVETSRALELPKPIYPRIAVAAHPSGQVKVQVLIDTDGTVIAANAIDGHPLLWAASVTAAKGARFVPTKHNGKPVKVTGIIVYYFVAR